SLGAVAEEPPAPVEIDAASQSPSPIPPEVTEGGIATKESNVREDVARVTEAPEVHTTESAPTKEAQESDQETSSSARITERTDRYQFAHRSSSRRARRGRGGPPPVKPDEHRGNGHTPKSSPMISELLREGQEILVQVSKEPLGKKGARITSHIALPGRYLVYMPTVDHVGVSRKIASDEERSRLK